MFSSSTLITQLEASCLTAFLLSGPPHLCQHFMDDLNVGKVSGSCSSWHTAPPWKTYVTTLFESQLAPLDTWSFLLKCPSQFTLCINVSFMLTFRKCGSLNKRRRRANTVMGQMHHSPALSLVPKVKYTKVQIICLRKVNCQTLVICKNITYCPYAPALSQLTRRCVLGSVLQCWQRKSLYLVSVVQTLCQSVLLLSCYRVQPNESCLS